MRPGYHLEHFSHHATKKLRNDLNILKLQPAVMTNAAESTSDMPLAFQAGMAVSADDDMIVDRDAKRL
jgi:hypothetical protein